MPPHRAGAGRLGLAFAGGRVPKYGQKSFCAREGQNATAVRRLILRGSAYALTVLCPGSLLFAYTAESQGALGKGHKKTFQLQPLSRGSFSNCGSSPNSIGCSNSCGCSDCSSCSDIQRSGGSRCQSSFGRREKELQGGSPWQPRCACGSLILRGRGQGQG
mmetsp:Transcript_47468/g.103186  ORF Transcript_47468/g.103186 Transcript_47468/m.103186 type:complete len:161 (-) Transcript_47468:429-911(-)